MLLLMDDEESRCFTAMAVLVLDADRMQTSCPDIVSVCIHTMQTGCTPPAADERPVRRCTAADESCTASRARHRIASRARCVAVVACTAVGLTMVCMAAELTMACEAAELTMVCAAAALTMVCMAAELPAVEDGEGEVRVGGGRGRAGPALHLRRAPQPQPPRRQPGTVACINHTMHRPQPPHVYAAPVAHGGDA
jgi:hypothetical protein